MKAMKKDHPGFKAISQKIAVQKGIPIKRAEAIVAAGARKASPKAMKKNPKLKKVAGAGSQYKKK